MGRRHAALPRADNYSFSISGLNVLALTGAKIAAAGEVYHLSKPEDFAGNYSGVAAGAALVAAMDRRNGEPHRGGDPRP